jgi:hypothetical protein
LTFSLCCSKTMFQSFKASRFQCFTEFRQRKVRLKPCNFETLKPAFSTFSCTFALWLGTKVQSAYALVTKSSSQLSVLGSEKTLTNHASSY